VVSKILHPAILSSNHDEVNNPRKIELLFPMLRSDPTENDSVEGLRPNARGPGLVTFGVCIDT
jgi:hypothetical protein